MRVRVKALQPLRLSPYTLGLLTFKVLYYSTCFSQNDVHRISNSFVEKEGQGKSSPPLDTLNSLGRRY